MNTMMRTAAATAGLLAALALPLGSQAATTTAAGPQQYSFQTRLFDRFHAGEYEGRMQLTVYPSGIVQGTYRPSDGGIRTVTGGVDGRRIWLDIGMTRPLHLSGTFSDGVLDTVANVPGLDSYEFQSVGTVKTVH